MINFRNTNLLLAARRFPLACLSAIVATIIGMYVIDINYPPGALINLILSGVIGVLLFLNLKIAVESHQLSSSILWGGRIAIVLILLSTYFFLLPDFYETFNTRLFRLPFQFGAVVISLHLLVSYLPFIKKGSQEDFWEYNKDIFLRFVESGFFAAVLFIGLSIAILALDHLFSLEVDELIYPRLFFFMSGVFHTFYFLSKFPTTYHDNILKEPIKPFLVFSQYIILPLVGLYMAILYAYAAKIAFTWSLPKGWVSQLSLWFSVVGIFGYLLNYFTTRFSDFKPIHFFKKYFFLILLLPVVLIFIAIATRITEYGVTEARYVVGLVGVWLLCISLYHILSKEKNLKVIPISLSLFLLFGVFSGPVNIFNSTLKSQLPRFKAELTDRNYLKDGLLVKQESFDVNDESYFNFTRQLKFLDERTDMSFLSNWIDEPLELKNESSSTDTLHRHENAKILADKLGVPFEIYRPNQRVEQEGKSFSYSAKDFRKCSSIGDNRYLIKFDSNLDRQTNQNLSMYFQIDSSHRSLILYNKSDKIDLIPLGAFIDTLTQNHSLTKDHGHQSIPTDDLNYYHRSDACEINFVFDSVYGLRSTDTETPKLKSISGTALVTLNQNHE